MDCQSQGQHSPPSHREASPVLKSITDAFFALDGEWRFTYLNGEAEKFQRRGRDELIGQAGANEFARAINVEFEQRHGTTPRN